MTTLDALEASVAIGEYDSHWLAAHGIMLLASGTPLAARVALTNAMLLGDTRPTTVLNLALAEGASGEQARAKELLRELTGRLPDWDEPWIRLAEIQRRNGDHAGAIIYYGHALECDPLRPEALIGLAVLRLGAGDGAAAQLLLLRCLGAHPDRIEAWDALGLALMQTGDAAAAESAFDAARQGAPENFEYALHRATAACLAERAEFELARLEAESLRDPLNATMPTARAVVLQKLGRRAEALDALEVAVALSPDAAVPALLLGEMLAQSPRGPDAIIALKHALALKPNDRRAANNLGAVLMRQHQHAEAARILRGVRTQHGDDPVCLCNLANATVLLGHQEEAVSIARQSIALAPDAVLPYRAMANVAPYHPDTRASELLGTLRAISDRLPREAPVFCNERDPARRLRLGLLSGSFRIHPVGWLTIAGLENLDPAAFDIHCFAQNASQDPIARRFRALATEWHDTDNLDDPMLARLARSLQIDVLIDLGGYGDSGRMPACARRLAPVQIKWVGMQSHSTGLAEMDWFITDRWETPADKRIFYSERLLQLTDGYVCYSPPPHAPDVAPAPALVNQYITFGCFNNLAKITPQVIAAWGEILTGVPKSRLILKTHQFSDAETQAMMASRFAAHGIDGNRIEFRGASPHREFLRQYGDVDIVLDPFPYTGGLTTCEALWMGVPTITLAGEIFAARHSCSHLSNVGLTDWITHDREEYIQLAIYHAADIAALQELRSGLRARVKASPLCDAPRFGRHLGIALRHAWTEWCDGS